MKRILLIISIALAAFSCRKAADPSVDNASQFVGEYKDPILGTTATVTKVDNTTISISYSLGTFQSPFKATITGSNSLGQSSAIYLRIDKQTVNSTTNLTIEGKAVYDSGAYIAIKDHGYLITEGGKIKLYYRAETSIAGSTPTTIYYVGEKQSK